MVRYNVAQLLKEPTGSVRGVAVSEASLPLGELVVERLEGGLVLTRTDAGIWAHGTLEAEVEAQCSRCLAAFAQPLRLEMDDQYYPAADLATGAPVPETLKEEDSFPITREHVLDLGEAVRQLVIARSPMKPLCRAGCAGICPHCGADRNRVLCRCSERRPDPRWARLEGLLTGHQGHQ